MRLRFLFVLTVNKTSPLLSHPAAHKLAPLPLFQTAFVLQTAPTNDRLHMQKPCILYYPPPHFKSLLWSFSVDNAASPDVLEMVTDFLAGLLST